MAHELTRTAGKIEMAYMGAKPWHRLGQELKAGASIETWREAAGMDWRIERAQVQYKAPIEGGSIVSKFPGKDVLYRGDTKAPLGVVSDGYKIVQPAEVLEFFRDLAEGEGFALETAGTMFGGRRFWALANIGDSAHIIDRNDKVGGYLLLSTSADGSLATEARFTTIRVVCNNTLSMATGAKANVRVNHRSAFDSGRVKGKLGIQATETFAGFINDMRALAEKPVSWTDAVKLTLALFNPDHEKLDQKERKELLDSKPVSSIGALLDGKAMGSNLDGIRQTGWGWLNAVTEYVDHSARARSDEGRLNSAWFGKGDELKNRARDLITAL